jgi:hypothetical protein
MAPIRPYRPVSQSVSDHAESPQREFAIMWSRHSWAGGLTILRPLPPGSRAISVQLSERCLLASGLVTNGVTAHILPSMDERIGLASSRGGPTGDHLTVASGAMNRVGRDESSCWCARGYRPCKLKPIKINI